jgi:RNA polymerase sigma factor (sigma-70 family)
LLIENFPEDNFNSSNSSEQDFIDHEEDDQLRTIVNKSLTNLTGKQQEIIYLRFDCELSYEDIADILEITVESCHKSVYRSINKIRIEAEKILCTMEKINFRF